MADAEIGPGSVLAGRYRLEDLIDEASGAKFWRATDVILARSVAVHIVGVEDPRCVVLLDAARRSATVSDPHFLRVLDAARVDGVAYVVNEWGAGMSLDRIIANETLTPRHAAWVVKEVAEAMVNAHRHGIGHGRLLPENVMVTEAGAVKLIGFVIDGALHADPPDAADPPVDTRADDVLNLAALLYAALVGKWPGGGGSRLADAPRDRGQPLRPRQVRAGVPRPLDAICDRVLNAAATTGGVPITTAHEICAALSDYLGDPTALAPTELDPPTSSLNLETQAFTPPYLRDHTAQVSAEPDQAEDNPAESNPAESNPGEPDPGESNPAEPEPTEPELTGPERKPSNDPDQTQAGVPGFGDSSGGLGQFSAVTHDQRRSPAPPPPPLPEPEPRPLFAPDPPEGRPRRTPPEAATEVRPTGATPSFAEPTTGHGTGSLPPVWGPDAAVIEEDTERSVAAPGRRTLKLAAILAVVLATAVLSIIAINLSRGPAPDEPGAAADPVKATPTAAKVLQITKVTDFDPEGNPPEEHPELAPLAIDGKPDTTWQTVTYKGNPKLGLLKDGVGLLVDLGSPVRVGEVRLTLVGSPTDLKLLAASPGSPAPTNIEGLDEVAAAEGAGTSVELKPKKSVRAQYLVVWLTSLPPYDNGYRGQIAEIEVRS